MARELILDVPVILSPGEQTYLPFVPGHHDEPLSAALHRRGVTALAKAASC